MGKVTEWCQSYKDGNLSFEELKQHLVTFKWGNLKWSEIFEKAPTMTEGAMRLDELGPLGFPEEDTIEEFEAAWLDDLLTTEEKGYLYDAIWDARHGKTPVQEAD